MIYRIIFFLFIALIMVSCGKERTIHVKAVNPVTNEPYDGLRVVITSSKTGWDGEKVETVHDGNLNSYGEAVIQLKIKKNRSYAIRCEQPSNTCYTKDLQYYYTVHDEQNPTFLFEYAQCAYLKLKVQNVNCQGPEDKIFFKRTWLSKSTYTNSVVKEGCFSFEGDFFELPEGQYLYEWEVTRNGNTTYHDSLFYIDKGESYTFLLEY